MAKIIKYTEKAIPQFKVGQTVKWFVHYHDGRSYETLDHTGEIVKICKVNLQVKSDRTGHIWSVAKTEVI